MVWGPFWARPLGFNHWNFPERAFQGVPTGGLELNRGPNRGFPKGPGQGRARNLGPGYLGAFKGSYPEPGGILTALVQPGKFPLGRGPTRAPGGSKVPKAGSGGPGAPLCFPTLGLGKFPGGGSPFGKEFQGPWGSFPSAPGTNFLPMEYSVQINLDTFLNSIPLSLPIRQKGPKRPSRNPGKGLFLGTLGIPGPR